MKRYTALIEKCDECPECIIEFRTPMDWDSSYGWCDRYKMEVEPGTIHHDCKLEEVQ